MSKECIISVPDDAGFVEYSYIRGGRKYNTHYAYRSMEHLVRCKDCKHRPYCCRGSIPVNDDGFCSDGERSDE